MRLGAILANVSNGLVIFASEDRAPVRPRGGRCKAAEVHSKAPEVHSKAPGSLVRTQGSTVRPRRARSKSKAPRAPSKSKGSEGLQ